MKYFKSLILALFLLLPQDTNAQFNNCAAGFCPGAIFSGGGSVLPPAFVVNPANPPDLMLDLANNQAWTRNTNTTSTAVSLVTVVNSTGGYVNDASGNWSLIGANTARRSNLGLLVEEARTNSALQSQNFGTTWGASSCSTTLDQTTAPDGTITADTIIENAVGAVEHYLQQTVAAVQVNTPVAYSIFAKAGTGTGRYINLHIFDATVTANFSTITADLQLGTLSAVLNSGAAGTNNATIETSANGFWRIKLVTTLASVSNTGILLRVRRAIGPTTGAADVVYTGDGTSFNYIWQAQLESGGSVTSIIPTTTVAVARSADYVTVNNASSIDITSNTLYTEHTPISVAQSNGVLIGISKALSFTNAEYYAAASGVIGTGIVGATGATGPATIGTLISGNNKFVGTYAIGAGNFAAALNGSLATGGGGSAAPAGPTTVATIGSAPWNAGSNLQSGFYAKAGLWFTQHVPNPQLITMTQ